ncbi:MAG: hypothetical protein EPN97_13195 [Alphaproteobacteria bacterium]|nr:MAG: hypothetical protein EPN97_13195 [Alphaproteobacteria bacterium]
MTSNETQKMLLDRRAAVAAELEMIDRMLAASGIAIPKQVRKAGPDTTTNGQKVLSVLSEAPAGMKTAQVVERVKEKFGKDLNLKHCSSILSVMRHEKRQVTLDEVNGVWKKV